MGRGIGVRAEEGDGEVGSVVGGALVNYRAADN